jgi:hypothetical protein
MKATMEYVKLDIQERKFTVAEVLAIWAIGKSWLSLTRNCGITDQPDAQDQ